MRKLSLFLAAFIFAATTWAQNGDELKNIAEKKISLKATGFDYLYGDTSEIVIKESISRSIIAGLGEHIELARYDTKMNEMARTPLDLPANCRYITGFNNKESIDILLSERDEKGTKLDVYHERLSPTTLKPVGELINLGTLTGEKTDNLGFICRQSPDKMLTAGIFVTQREGQGAEARVVLYDRKFEEYWSMTTRLRVVDFASVTDNGEVIIGGYRPQAIPDRNDFEIIVLDGEKNHTYNFTLDAGEIADVDLAGWRDGKLHLLAIGRKKKHKKDNGAHADRVISICYNSVSDKVTSDTYTFSEEEMNRMNNRSNVAGIRQGEVHFLGIENTVESPDGHCDVLLTQSWTVIGKNNDMSYVTSGIMIVTIDTDGKVKRVYTRPHASECSQFYGRTAKYRLMRAKGGSVLIYSDNKKNVDRKITKKYKGYSLSMNKAALTVLFIPDNGEIEEKTFLTDKFGLTGAPIPMCNNKYMLFMRTFKKFRLTTLDLQ